MKDLLKLYTFESVHSTADETAIADWICKWLDQKGVKYKRKGNTIFKLDEKDAPILSAHLDQVRTNGKVHKLFMKDGIIFAYNDKWQRTSLGADDKNGVWIILKALEEAKEPFNFIISEGEETGLVGIHKLEEGELDAIDFETQWCIVLDRRGNDEILKGGGGTTYCCTLAQDLINFLGNDYKISTGSVSDTAVLCKYCESVNMSVGYAAPHTANETTDFNALDKIKQDVIDVIDGFVHYPTDPVTYSFKGVTKYGK